MDELNKAGKFQGYSGMVYCGKKTDVKDEGHDGIWGPDNGPPWDEWLKCVYNEKESMNYFLKQVNIWNIF